MRRDLWEKLGGAPWRPWGDAELLAISMDKDRTLTLSCLGAGGGSSAGACLPPMTGYWHITFLVWRLAEIDDPLPKGGVSPKGNTIICLGSDGLYEFLGSTLRGAY